MNIAAIPIFSDNYVWLLSEGADAVVVDPGDAAPVQRALAVQGLSLRAILITHWHADHIGGLAQLLSAHPVPVYGPEAEAERIPALTQALSNGDSIEVLGRRFEVLHVPGHTLGHIAFVHDDILLCGDTLFSAGCGRLFEGTAAQMQASLNRLVQLPENTRVYCTHEYTAANLAFAMVVEPGNTAVQEHARLVQALRKRHLPTLPSSLGLEKRINPFLRCAEPAIHRSVETHCGQQLTDTGAVFASLRRWKDTFTPPKL